MINDVPVQVMPNIQYNTCENVVCLIVLIVHLKLYKKNPCNTKIQYNVNEIKGHLSVYGVYFHDYVSLHT